uniref:Uncharacterized protein n=1 Tax=Physcomitrium patens TaxID=3218 RepID=A0A2K1KD26_PHYPA|nr:hypothetical protein PHYPA_010873 [Physcomitrium patens]
MKRGWVVVGGWIDGVDGWKNGRMRASFELDTDGRTNQPTNQLANKRTNHATNEAANQRTNKSTNGS